MRVTLEILFGRMNYIENEFRLKKQNIVKEYCNLPESKMNIDDFSDEDFEAIYSLLQYKRNFQG